MLSRTPFFGEQATDRATGRPVWWDGHGWSYIRSAQPASTPGVDGNGARSLLKPQAVRPERIPLSYAQQRLWFVDRLQGASSEYNIMEALRLRGKLDQAALERAINLIVKRHESLRTHFIEVEGEPVQVIASELQIALPVFDLSGMNKSERESAITAAMLEEAALPFDLSRGPMLRMRLLRLHEEEHILLRTVHHIAFDGWSMSVFDRELRELYESFQKGREHLLEALPVQYADFVLWQREWLNEERMQEHLKYWKEQLAGIPEELELERDRPRPAIRTFAGEQRQVCLGEELTAGLKKLSQEAGTTLYMTLLAGFAVLLERYSGQEDIVVGTPIANRQEAQLEDLIGFFVNTLAMRIRVNRQQSFEDLLKEVRETALDAYRHQDLPFEKLVEAIRPERSLNRTPIFQVMFALQNVPDIAQRLQGLQVERLVQISPTARFDLEVFSWEESNDVRLLWVYKRDLFDSWRIEQMEQHYIGVLENMVARPGLKVAEFDFLKERERREILEEFNATERALPEKTVQEWFEEQVERNPKADALRWEGGRLSYRALNERANRLAHFLIAEGVGAEDVVGICLERSPEMVVSLFAILKAGAAYLPLDIEYPQERLASMLADAKPLRVISRRHEASHLPWDEGLVLLDDDGIKQALQQLPVGNPDNKVRVRPLGLQHPAYVIYTSGSTGKPKGILMPGSALSNLIHWQVGTSTANPGCAVAQLTPIFFDVSVQEFFSTLVTGMTLTIASSELRRSPSELVLWLNQEKVQRLFAPNLIIEAICEQAHEQGINLDSLSELIQAGEALTLSEHIRRFCQGTGKRQLYNHYGPTETHAAAAFELPVDVNEWPQAASIGKPIWNVQVYVLDETLQLAPVGVSGEIYIGGVGLARGYFGKPGLTAERFVASPYGGQGERMYRTGDRGRWRRDGNLEFLGRADDQVKIRGFRIEPGEIEAVLKGYPGVKQVAVVAREGGAGHKQLVGYVVAAGQQKVDERELREYLRKRLPEYMVPAAILEMDTLPLTASGKLNKTALPAPQFGGSYESRRPRTPQEEVLCGVFAEVLGIERVGIDDNFFDLGGHSLLATRLMSRIRSILGVELLIRTVFEAPSVHQLLPCLDQGGAVGIALRPWVRPDRIPLSYAQQRLWFLDRLQGTSTEYNMPEALRLRGKLDRAALERSINTIVERHESLRTHFEEGIGEPVQRITGELKIEVPVEDVSGLEQNRRAERVREAIEWEWEEPFVLETGPLLRIKLLKLGEEEHILLRTMHHIATDGWSMGVFNREFRELYEAYREGRENPLKPLTVQYADFALWQRERMNGERTGEELQYWKGQLAGIPQELELGKDRPRPAVQAFIGEQWQVNLGKEMTAEVKKLSRRMQATLYMTLLAGFALVLERYSGQEDIVVGSPIANRQEAQLEDLIGFFVNTLVMRVRVQKEKRVEELVAEVRAMALEAYRHQDLPFEHLVEELSPERSLNRPPIFQVVFALQNAPLQEQRLSGLEVETVESEVCIARFDLEVHAWEQGDDLTLLWVYNRDLFDAWRMEQMGRHYVGVLKKMIAAPEMKLAEICFLGESERREILEEFNATRRELPEKCIHELFEEQVGKNPEATAIVYEDQCLSYGELNEQANRLAHHLIGLGVKADTLVGFCVERSVEMVVGILGILKAGGAYVPLDPGHPQERLEYMLEDSLPAVVLTQSWVEEKLGRCTAPVLRLDTEQEKLKQYPETNPEREAVGLTPNHLAYVIYTSGSTGRPKGVLIGHRGLINVITASLNTFAVRQGSGVVQLASLTFDASVLEIFTALLGGATLYLVKRDALLSTTDLGRFLQENAISTMVIPPSLLSLIPAGDYSELRTIIVGGETCSGEVAARWASGRVFLNAYAPTEATIYATLMRCESGEGQAPAIGRPIANTKIYLLDEYGELVPMGVVGEIYIGGAGVARGYLNRAELTAERFVPEPYSSLAGARMYKSGDLGRYLRDGNLEFLGRNDFQVKIRGLRIELGEIEARLREHEAVGEAVVLAREDTPGDKRLVAYYTRTEKGEGTVGAEELRRHLSSKLPEYMVPAAYVRMEKLPLTANGKLDRKALPQPEFSSRSSRSLQTAAEVQLCSLFADILNLEHVEPDDNFFELGGHSLLATQLVGRIRKTMGLEISIRALFEAPTVSRLAALKDQKTNTNPFEVMLPIRDYGSLPPLFFIHPAGGLSWAYAGLLKYIEEERPLYGLQARTFTSSEPPAQTIEEMAVDYIHEVRKIQSTGPYYIAAWSFGGLIAHSMASIFQHQGEQVALLSLLDISPSPAHKQGGANLEEPPTIMDAVAEVFGQDLRGELPNLAMLYKRICQDGRLPPAISERRFTVLMENLMRSGQLKQRFVPTVYVGNVSLFTATAEAARNVEPVAAAWKPYIDGEIRVYPIACAHRDMINPEGIALIGPLFAAELKKAADCENFLGQIIKKNFKSTDAAHNGTVQIPKSAVPWDS